MIAATPVSTPSCLGREDGVKVRIKTTPRAVRVGHRLFFRIENLGTQAIDFGVQWSVEQLSKGRWAAAPFSPRGPWTEQLLELPAGERMLWQRFTIPETATPGLYRLRKPIEFANGNRPCLAPFRVVG
ncbi:MAG TPA: immunoglobulin-like domain-containing protein [Solirubrobacterales bacterium]|nr:immunoglobulin-like domain-containing protein [Solirubrobacterales bacterium]